MLSPRLDPTYYSDNNEYLLQMMNDYYNSWLNPNLSYWAEADRDARFRAGDQTLWGELYGVLPTTRNRYFVFNRIRRILNMISGYQRKNRKQTICVASEDSKEHAANQMSKALIWAHKHAKALEILSDAFDGAITTGMNLLSVWLDYRTDPINGDFVVDNHSYNAYMIDPFFKKLDLSDCNGLWGRKYISKQQAISLMPDREKEIMNMTGQYNRDGKFQYLPESYNYANRGLLVCDEFWHLSSRTQTVLVDTTTGDTMEWRGTPDDMEDFIQTYPHVRAMKNEIPTVKLAIILQGRVMYYGANPLGIDRYPFVPVVAYYNPELPYPSLRCQSVTRDLRDPQFLYSHRKRIELDILESQLNSGWVAKEDSMVNPKDLFQTGQGKPLFVKQEAEISDIQRIMPAALPPTTLQVSQILGDEISQISGVNEELLGSATDDKAGILAQLRQGAGLTTLQPLFDKLDYSQMTLGKIFMESMQVNWTPGKIRRITGQEPSPEFTDKLFGKYDVVLAEAPTTDTQKQLAFIQALHLREMGIPVPAAYLLKHSTLQDKEDLVKEIAQQEQQAAQQASQKMQAEIALLKAQIQDMNARSVANQGLGMERASRIQENQQLAVERRAKAIKEVESASLDQVKAAKELQSIDLENLMNAIQILQALQAGSLEQAGLEQAPNAPQSQPFLG